MLAIMWGIGRLLGLLCVFSNFIFNWQACFYFLQAYRFLGCVAFLIIRTHFKRQPLKISQIKK